MIEASLTDIILWRKGDPLNVVYLDYAGIGGLKLYFVPGPKKTWINKLAVHGTVKKIIITLPGKYNLPILTQFGYKHDEILGVWYFDSVTDRYIFDYSYGAAGISITVGRKPGGDCRMSYEVGLESALSRIKNIAKNIIYYG